MVGAGRIPALQRRELAHGGLESSRDAHLLGGNAWVISAVRAGSAMAKPVPTSTSQEAYAG
jgi:hypothetical protein